MASRGNIPGFVFDEERGRYFPVQPNHLAPTAASYSESAVKANIQAEELKKVTEVKIERLRRGRISRSSLRTSYLDYRLNSQLGISQPGSSAQNTSLARHYAASLSYTTAVLPSNTPRNLIGFTTFNSSLNVSWCHPETPDFYMMVGHHHSTATTRLQPNESISLTRPTRMAAIDQEFFVLAGDQSYTIASSNTSNRGNESWGGLFDVSNSRDLAVSPDGQKIAFATGKDISFLLLASSSRPPNTLAKKNFTSKREFMVTSFLDNNILMSGDRSGSVFLSDLRVDSGSGHVHRLQHSSGVNGITHTRTANEILVSGLESIAVYDLRYIKDLPTRVHPSNCSKCHGNALLSQRRQRRQNHTTSLSHPQIIPYPCTARIFPPTQPLVLFNTPPSRFSQYYTNAGKSLAYIASVDIAVVASHRAASVQQHDARSKIPSLADRITLYHASTGRLLPSVFDDIVYDGEVQQVGVHRMRDGPESILVCAERRKIQEFRVDLLLRRNGRHEWGGGDEYEEGDVDEDDDREGWRRQNDTEANGLARRKCKKTGKMRTNTTTMMKMTTEKEKKTTLHDEYQPQYTLIQDRYPPDAELGTVEKWDRGNLGPLY